MEDEEIEKGRGGAEEMGGRTLSVQLCAPSSAAIATAPQKKNRVFRTSRARGMGVPDMAPVKALATRKKSESMEKTATNIS